MALIAQVEKPPCPSGMPILTLPQARDITYAALKGDKGFIAKTLRVILFLIKEAVKARKSHIKKKTKLLKKRVEELDAVAA